MASHCFLFSLSDTKDSHSNDNKEATSNWYSNAEYSSDRIISQKPSFYWPFIWDITFSQFIPSRHFKKVFSVTLERPKIHWSFIHGDIDLMPGLIFVCKLVITVVYCVQGQWTAVVWWRIPFEIHITSRQLNSFPLYNRSWRFIWSKNERESFEKTRTEKLTDSFVDFFVIKNLPRRFRVVISL